MSRFVLVPFDDATRAEQALPFVARLAHATAAQVVLLQMARPWRPARLGVAADLMRLQSCLAERGIPAAGLTLDEDPSTEPMIEAIIGQPASWIVLATRAGSTVEQPGGDRIDAILQRAVASVFLLPAAYQTESLPGAPIRLLAPFDGSPRAEAAVGPIRALAATLAAELLLLRALEWPDDRRSRESRPGRLWARNRALAEASLYLEQIAGRFRTAGLAVATHASVGTIGAVIATVLRQIHLDAIAVTALGTGRPTRLPIGSVSAEVLARASLPVLLVRPGTGRPLVDVEAVRSVADVRSRLPLETWPIDTDGSRILAEPAGGRP